MSEHDGQTGPAAPSGSGPGARTRDGCSVEVYRTSPYRGELDDGLPLLPPASTVLDLGCGTGRLARVLIDHGHAVTAVDNSPDMLAELPGAAIPVLGDIESLALDRRFDVVLLASYLVNLPDAPLRHAFLATAHRHLEAGGSVVLQRHVPALLDAVPKLVRESADVAFAIESVARSREPANRIAMTVRYDRGGESWRHSFVADVLDEDEIEGLLRAAGFERHRWLGAERGWVIAQRGGTRACTPSTP